MGEEQAGIAATGTRRLAAIMFTDIVGFSRQMGTDEARMLRLLETHNQLIQQVVNEHHGQVIKIMGDAFLVDFPSVVNAVQCAQHIVYLFKKQHERAIAEAERAITLDPNYAVGHVILGDILFFAGRPEETIEHVQRAMRLNPRFQPGT